MTQEEKTITTEDFTQGRYVIEFPDEMDADEITMLKTHLFAFFQRHGCRIRKKDETNSNT